MKDTFTLEENLTVLEILRLSFYLAVRNKIIKKFLIFFPFLFIAYAVLKFVVIQSDTSFSLPLKILIIFSFALIPFALVSILLIVFVFYLLKSKPNNYKNIKYTFTTWGATKVGIGFKHSHPWKKIVKFKETKFFFLLYISETDAYMLSKKMFHSSEELIEFKKFALQNIS